MGGSVQQTTQQLQNCLDDITRRAARVALAEYDAVRVPYICQISGSPNELMVISRYAAERMVVATKGVINVNEARILGLVHIAHLCLNDIADLLRWPVRHTQAILHTMMQRGLVTKAEVDGVELYAQLDGEVHSQFTDLALGALHA